MVNSEIFTCKLGLSEAYLIGPEADCCCHTAPPPFKVALLAPSWNTLYILLHTPGFLTRFLFFLHCFARSNFYPSSSLILYTLPVISSTLGAPPVISIMVLKLPPWILFLQLILPSVASLIRHSNSQLWWGYYEISGGTFIASRSTCLGTLLETHVCSICGSDSTHHPLSCPVHGPGGSWPLDLKIQMVQFTHHISRLTKAAQRNILLGRNEFNYHYCGF